MEKGINRTLKARIPSARCQERTAPSGTSNRVAHAPHCSHLAPLPALLPEAPWPCLETPDRRRKSERGCGSPHCLRGSVVGAAPGCPRRAEGLKFGHFGSSGRGVPVPLPSWPRTRYSQCRGEGASGGSARTGPATFSVVCNLTSSLGEIPEYGHSH